MSILDSSAAVSEAPSAPLDGIESQAEGAAEHLPNGSPEAAPENLPNGSPETAAEHFPDASAETASEHLPDAAVEVSHSAASSNSALSASAAGEEASAAEPVLEPSTEQSARKQRGRPFKPGQSGNPNGRPKGTRNVVTRAVEALIDGQGEALGAKAIEKAEGVLSCGFAVALTCSVFGDGSEGAAAVCGGGNAGPRDLLWPVPCVSFQSLRATLIGSMPACRHHARSSRERCTAR
jgi:hypothetical protein